MSCSSETDADLLVRATENVLHPSDEMPEGSKTCKGYDFNKGIDYHEILNSYRFSGFQVYDDHSIAKANENVHCSILGH